MYVWTYVITYDEGGAPNFEPPATTLTVCKPRIRRAAERGDVVLAFNGARLNPAEPHSVRWAGVADIKAVAARCQTVFVCHSQLHLRGRSHK
jgi:hypothetical protein